MPFWLNFLYDQLFTSLPYPKTDFNGQTIIVTGSNVGLGLEAARHFARLNASKIILAVRSLDKGEAAKRSIEESTKRSNVVEVWQLDLSSYESVKQFANRVEGLKRLDALVENAGIATNVYKVFEDNESTITTNVVSTFLLALLVLPKLRETAAKFNITPRLVITSSEVHFFPTFPERKSPRILDTLNGKEKANMAERYPVSKLLEVFFVRELADRTKQSGKSPVVINCLNPGLCHSELARDSGIGLAIMKFFLARTTEAGSRTIVAAVEAGMESHGQYMSNSKVADASPLVRSADGAQTQKRIFEELSQKLETIQPGIMANV